MKKILLLFGLATMFTGCSNDETVELVQQSVINFSSLVNKNTTTDNLKNVWVYGWRSNSEGDTNQLFKGTELTKQDGGDWTYSTLKYWEPGYKYAFEAIAPQNGTKGVTFTAAKDGGTVVFDNSIANAKVDLVYANLINKDYSLATYANLANSKVSLTFNHLLSRVMFTFKNGLAAASNAKISVSDVKITNAYSKGTVTPAKSATWTIEDNTNTLAVSFPASTTNALTDLEPTKSGVTEHKYFIPATNTSYQVTFTFKLDRGDGVTTTVSRTTTTPTMSMQNGKNYNFVAELSLDSIKFTVMLMR
jgi:hypothetical protein